ncbi:hypothetical protein GMDG_03117 [Pseudogymnoascus destructans 20631-21]|uniref:Uncharacterized protein n=1 Tax=Pseudogymnoascus destructans (strain ATCC MYA-4855 / 20631-21) TaxID=658429 RepID=L8G5B6_PSED2|nr:hypothetical protein GMDG_03117 [Pseudogymnoascus destructans 20631-21]
MRRPGCETRTTTSTTMCWHTRVTRGDVTAGLLWVGDPGVSSPLIEAQGTRVGVSPAFIRRITPLGSQSTINNTPLPRLPALPPLATGGFNSVGKAWPDRLYLSLRAWCYAQGGLDVAFAR